jgi:hypothetical protein
MPERSFFDQAKAAKWNRLTQKLENLLGIPCLMNIDRILAGNR